MSNLQKIVTFTTYHDEDVQAQTAEEFTNDGEFAEWVWHMAPTKEAAIARHDEAMKLFEESGEFSYFIHDEVQA